MNYWIIYSSSNPPETWEVKLSQAQLGTFGPMPPCLGHMRSLRAMWHNFSSCDWALLELQPCCSSNAPEAWVYSHLLAVLGHFWSDDVTCVSRELTSGQLRSLSIACKGPHGSYWLLAAKTHLKRKNLDILKAYWGAFGLTTSLPGNVRSFPVMWRQFCLI